MSFPHYNNYIDINYERMNIMIASDKSLTYFCQNVQFAIPFFQRRYVWTEDNWAQFWDELTSQNDYCFLGTIILKQKKNYQTTDYGVLNDCMMVIDGQQRLTTLSLLLRALVDKIASQGNATGSFEKFFYYLKERRAGWESSQENWCKLIQSRFDYGKYKDIIFGKKADPIKICRIITDEKDPEYSAIEHCYRFFSEKLNNATDLEINSLFDKVNNDMVKPIVIIELGENEDEQKIFDSVNSTGVPLTVSEIIKNALFESCDPQKAEILHDNEWKNEFEIDVARVRAWTSMKGSGQNSRAHIDSFFLCYATLKGFFDPANDRQSHLVQHYKDHIAKQSQSEEIVKDIVGYAKTYREFFIESNNSDAFSFADGKLRLFKILKEAKISTFDPYVLKLLVEKSGEELSAELLLLEKYVMRHFAVHSDQIKSFNADCIKMLAGTFNFNEEMEKDVICDEAVSTAFEGYVPNHRAKLILYWIELHRMSKNPSADNSAAKLQYKPFELEHIMPQEWSANWQPICDDAQKDITQKYIYQIGNMTLLTSKMNKQVSNRPFSEKMNGCTINGKKEPGVRELSTLSITTEFSSKDSWGGNNISERTKSLADEFCSIWK